MIRKEFSCTKPHSGSTRSPLVSQDGQAQHRQLNDQLLPRVTALKRPMPLKLLPRVDLDLPVSVRVVCVESAHERRRAGTRQRSRYDEAPAALIPSRATLTVILRETGDHRGLLFLRESSRGRVARARWKDARKTSSSISPGCSSR